MSLWSGVDVGPCRLPLPTLPPEEVPPLAAKLRTMIELAPSVVGSGAATSTGAEPVTQGAAAVEAMEPVALRIAEARTALQEARRARVEAVAARAAEREANGCVAEPLVATFLSITPPRGAR